MTLAIADMGGALRAANAWALLGVLVAIVVLAGWGLIAWLRQRRAAAGSRRQAALPMVCPSCRRGYPAGTQYCTVDAERLVHAHQAARGGRCPRCHRVFGPGMRFCPLDAEELHVHDLHESDEHGMRRAVETHDHIVGGDGKICPMCASRYDVEAMVCGRDGSELVTVN